MELRRLFAPFLLFVFVIPLCGQVQSRAEVDSLLEAANKALDHYQHLAPSIHCEEATKTEFRDVCKIGLENSRGAGSGSQDGDRTLPSELDTSGCRFIRCLYGINSCSQKPTTPS